MGTYSQQSHHDLCYWKRWSTVWVSYVCIGMIIYPCKHILGSSSLVIFDITLKFRYFKKKCVEMHDDYRPKMLYMYYFTAH